MMKYRKFLSKMALGGVLVAGVFVAANSAAQAAVFNLKFYTSGGVYTDAYAGESMHLATDSLATLCPTPAATCPADDVIGDPLNFLGGAVQATAGTAVDSYAVWDDLKPVWGGLGVKEPGATPDDQIGSTIATTDVLKIAFGTAVTLTGVETLFAAAHNPFGTLTAADIKDPSVSSAISFLLSTDGVTFSPISFLAANKALLSITSTAFYFMQNTADYGCVVDVPGSCKKNPFFYVSALRVTSSFDQLPPIPIPAALPLFFGALGGLAMIGRLRKRRQSTAA